jgi:hypothetical protein
MIRLLYAVRFILWMCIIREGGPNRPFGYYLKLYDRRQYVFHLKDEEKQEP